MRITRRRAVGLIGSTLAAPFVLIPDKAKAAARLRRVGRPIELGKRMPGGKFKVSLSAFPNGGFIAGFLNFRSSLDTRAYIRYYDAAGQPLSDNIQMGAPSGLTDGTPANSIVPVANADGSAVVFFGASDNHPSAPSDDIFAQPMTVGMQESGLPKRINTRTRYTQSTVLAVQLQQQGASPRAEAPKDVLAAWLTQGLTLDSYNVKGVKATLVDGELHIVGDEFLMTDGTRGMQVPRSLTALGNGGAALEYTTFLPNLNVWKSGIQLFDLGYPAGDPFVVKRTEGEPVGVGIAAESSHPADRYGWAVAVGRQDPFLANLSVQPFDENGLGRRRLIRQFDFNLEFPPPPPRVVTYRDLNLGEIAVITHNAVTDEEPSRQTVEGLIAALPDGEIVADSIPLWISPGDRRITNDALIEQPDNVYVSAFSDNPENGDPQESRALVQRLQAVILP